uniref:Uncharacterized protein n=1 Tax=Kalanchoe fedtschenkoi TaxID=63787 RepID=A0A7N0T913_KALFE
MFTQALIQLYNALRAMGNVWGKNKKWIPDLMADTNDDSFDDMNAEELGGRLLAKLDGMINMARKMLDAMDEEEKNKENRIQGWASGDTLNASYLDSKVKCPSPDSTTLFLPEQKVLMTFGELAEASCSHPLHMPLRLQSLGQLSPNLVRQLSFSKSPPASPKSISSMEQEMAVDKQKQRTSATASNHSLVVARRKNAENNTTQSINPSSAVAYHTPPPTVQPSIRPSPPPPPPILLANGSVPQPSSPAIKASKSAPPPPPVLCLALRAKKTNTKLKKSSQMGNLYRLLKGKVEGPSLNNKQGKLKSHIGGAAGGKQGMADALAEMARRSAYFQQIEADVQNHAKSIMEVKAALISFKTNNMIELANFHRYVEQHLEKLSDETQVLARFEGFPSRKLETLRMAAALFAKLEGMITTLENTKVERPLGQLLQRVETYLTKVKREIDALERTKDEESKRFQSQNIFFNFDILVKVKESMVDVSSNCMELALTDAKDAKALANGPGSNCSGQPVACQKLLWRTFQLAYQVYSFAGGHDDRAERLTRELAKEIENIPDQE